MRVHDLSPMPADFYLLRPQPKSADGEQERLSDIARQEAQRQIDEKLEERRKSFRRQTRKLQRATDYQTRSDDDATPSDIDPTGANHIDLLA